MNDFESCIRDGYRVKDLQDMQVTDMEALRIKLEMEVAIGQAVLIGIAKEMRRRRRVLLRTAIPSRGVEVVTSKSVN